MAGAPASTVRLPGSIDLIGLHALAPARYPFLLQSLGGAAALGRFDILFAFPGAVLSLNAALRLQGAPAAAGSDFLAAFDHWWLAERSAGPGGDLPFTGGWFVVLGYELAQQVEPGVALPTEPMLPVAQAVRIPAAVIHDHLTGATTAVAEAGHESLLAEIVADAARVADLAPVAGDELPAPAGSCIEDDPAPFLQAVGRAAEYIARGDVYQVNLSRQWRGVLAADCPAWQVYSRLRRTNPSPFAGLARFGDAWILSSSPERLVEVRGTRVRTRPIAGTRPRGTGAVDVAHRVELAASDKERAEHVMLIDLERNDLGRICRAGSVQVEDFMTIESYAHVHHIVSGIGGVLLPGTGPGAVLRAVFPGGTITGCPKVRSLEIIRELEGRPRGPYTGSMGYVSRDGSCDFNILIRTIALQGSSWRACAGSGIVADSIPARELDETRAKARGMLLALQSGES